MKSEDEQKKSQEEIKFNDFARLVLDSIESLSIDYLIGGSVANWAWGEVRTTQDIDLVINLPGDRIVALSEALAKRDMLVPPDVIIDLLIQSEGDLPINAIHLGSGFKAEMFLLRDGDVYRKTALSRRRLVDLGEPIGEVYVHAPEDLIINKVHYYSLSQQTKHIRDIASMLVYSGELLDEAYLGEWMDRLGLEETWEVVNREVQKLVECH